MEENNLVVNEGVNVEENTTETNTDENNSTDVNAELETVKAQLLKAQQDNAKLKNSLNKASSEASEYKKRWKSTQTEAEQRAIEKEEDDKRVRDELEKLKRANELNKHIQNCLSLGYQKDDAQAYAEAILDGNTDEMYRIQKKVAEEQALAIKSNNQKAMSSPPSGNGKNEVTKEQFAKMNWRQRQELYNKDKDTYNKLKG